MTPERASFTCALVERLLAADGHDPAAVAVLEAALRGTGRSPDPLQQPDKYYPGLTARPWHDPAQFGWVPALEAAYPQIRAEALALADGGGFRPDPLSEGLADGTWHEFRLFTEGRPDPAHCRAAPRTAQVVAAIAGATTAGLVYFSLLAPGTHVRPHFGPHNARLRCHLGLVVPDGCALRVGAQTGGWTQGKAIVFDDSYEHEVWNRSDQYRLVLILDIWHPGLTPAQIAAIRLGSQAVAGHAYEVAAGWRDSGSVPRLLPVSSGL
jgi:aspartyl/asparaginyl beta-hydroxylase (cupin superfamily)